MHKTTRELAEDYAANFDDVSLVHVAKNGAYAVFEEPNDWGSAPMRRRISRRKLATLEIIQTPYGPVVVDDGNEH